MPKPYPWKAGDVIGNWVFVERVCANKAKAQCRYCGNIEIIYSCRLGFKHPSGQKICNKCHYGAKQKDDENCLTDEEVKYYREKYKNGVTVDILREWLGA